MTGRIPLLIVLFASLTLAGEATARGSGRDAAIAGAVVGALIGGAIVANSRYDRVPVYVEYGVPPPRYYYEPYPGYYRPPTVYYQHYPVVVEPRYRFNSHHKFRHHKHDFRRHDFRRHDRYRRDRYRPRR